MTDPANTSTAYPLSEGQQQAEEPTVELAVPLAQAAPPTRPRRGELLSLPAVILIVAVAALFITTVLLILFSSSNDSVNALAVVAVAIVALTASYFGVHIATQQLREERAEKASALARVTEAEASVRESDAWAGQMEAGLRVAMVKLQAAGISSDDVVKAAGAPDDFF